MQLYDKILTIQKAVPDLRAGSSPGRLFYRFMNSKYVDDFLSGRKVKFGTLDEYRGFYDGQSRVDSMYFASLQIPDRPHMPFPGLEEREKQILGELKEKEGIEDLWEGIDAYAVHLNDTVNGITIRNSSSICFLPNMAVFCGSNSLTATVVERMRSDSIRMGAEPYDVCIPISNYMAFQFYLTRAIRDRFDLDFTLDATIARINYAEAGGIVSGFQTPSAPSPFVKRPTFSEQDEVRYVLHHPLPDFAMGELLNLKRDLNRFCWDPIDLNDAFPILSAA
jgi:hypothetical protein